MKKLKYSVHQAKKSHIQKLQLLRYVQTFQGRNPVVHLKTLMRWRNSNKCQIQWKIVIVLVDWIGNLITCLEKKKMELMEILRMKLHNCLAINKQSQNPRNLIKTFIMSSNSCFDWETLFSQMISLIFFSTLF